MSRAAAVTNPVAVLDAEADPVRADGAVAAAALAERATAEPLMGAPVVTVADAADTADAAPANCHAADAAQVPEDDPAAEGAK